MIETQKKKKSLSAALTSRVVTVSIVNILIIKGELDNYMFNSSIKLINQHHLGCTMDK